MRKINIILYQLLFVIKITILSTFVNKSLITLQNMILSCIDYIDDAYFLKQILRFIMMLV